MPGETDLATVYPQLIEEWDFVKNNSLIPPIKPTDVTSNSNKKVWWICKNGHSWQSTIYSRTNGTGCPFCSGKKAMPGETDLATLNPTLAKEWDFKKNNTLIPPIKPTDVTSNSNKKVWWICKNGHSWQSIINNRTKGTGCPFCSGKKAIPGETDLATLNPTLAKEWDSEKNNTLIPPIKPTDVTSNSNKKVWWICKNGHSWQATINSRANGSGCPFCSKKKAIPGETDLATLNPTLAKEWHPTKNGTLKPSAVTLFSNRKVWWLCENGHSWQATTAQRTCGKGCPYCHGILKTKPNFC